ncbi:MAG TPA: lysozyme inhibitor LprI family protein, partial [Rhodopila sp.]|nr:lysozyme inhibitor LprI family protein [Rhodopila sp.]
MTEYSGVPALYRYAKSSPRIGLICAAALSLLPGIAAAQSFDCGKAQDPVDRAICASPRLRQLDTDLASAYTAALKRPGAQADTIRLAQRSWARSRAACIGSASPSGHSSNPEQCLAAAYTARLAALASPDVAPRTATAAAAAPPPSNPAPPPTQQPQPSDFATPRPASGLPAIPAAAGTLERTHFPTAGETDILLHVTSPGRFAIRASSATGTALQLVDMLTGPGDRQGYPGKQDGRIDALLDTGTYKLRAFGEAAASGDTTLTLGAFAQPDPAQLTPGYQPIATTLSDLQQRSYWFAVGDGTGPVRIEAAGRSLAALALWRDGRDLVDLPADTNLVNATPAHPMTDIVLSGPVPPGTYLVTVYGGPKLSWTDGSADEPLYLRTGRSDRLLAGGSTGTVGVFGNEIFDLPRGAVRALLSLPRPADTELQATATGVEPETIQSFKNDRARAGLLTLPKQTAKDRAVTLRAAPGQAFVLRPLAGGQVIARPGLNAVYAQPGRYRFDIDQPAAGGDEAPAAAMLLRFHLDNAGKPDGAAQVLASPGVPAIGPGIAWRTRFNLRGETLLLFHVTAAVTVAVHPDGPPLTARITTPEGAVMNAMGGGAVATSWALSPGWYTLVLTPKPKAAGILDLTLGPPGVMPAAAEAAGLEAPVLPLGEQIADAQSRLAVLVNHVPDTPSVLTVRPVPVDIADFPLLETLPAGPSSTVEAHTRVAGTLTVRDIAAPSAAESRPVEADATTRVTLPAADHARTMAVALLPEAKAASPAPAPVASLQALQAGEPVFLNLRRDEQANFALTVPQGGLYQVQTTGRLKTAGRIGTAFIPDLNEAEANGVGNNMLLQGYLRAGRYRLEVTAHDSAGRLGVTAATTALSRGGDLLPGGTARATLAPGSGVVFPIRIDTKGRYHLDLLGDGRQFSARLEDADGWPLRSAGTLSAIDQDFTPGDYRLIVQPISVEARAVARLRRIEPPVTLSGHGPHPLPFEAVQSLEWREPANRDDPRTPDLWTFELAGPAKVTLTLTGDGMAATLESGVSKQEGARQRPLGRVVVGTPLSIDLPAGHYRVMASSLGRNDRLAYTIALHSDALQPDVPRRTMLPAELTFSIAEPRVVALTSFGATPVRAELRDAAGAVLARAAGRTDDWNIAVSRRLPTGAYRLAVAPLAPPAGARATSGSDGNASSSDSQDAGQDDSQSGDQSDDSNGGMSADNQDQSSDQGDQSS